MKIVQLTASNVKRLRAVEIQPDGHLQVIGGRNAQGKSSVLDAIWLALAGGKASKETAQPIRDGEKRAQVTVDLGDLTVTRTWTQKGTTLKVQGKDGATFPSPQAMLDRLVGQLSFDPLAFTRMSPREQRDAVVRMADLPFDVDDMAAEVKALREARADIGRQAKAIGEADYNPSLPTEEASVTEVMSALQRAQEHNMQVRALVGQIVTVENTITTLREQLAAAEDHLTALRAKQAELGDEINSDEIRYTLTQVEERNRQIAANNREREKHEKLEQLRAAYRDKTTEIASIEQRLSDGLAAARFPVEGLGFDDDGVTFNGVPFRQASSAEQIRVAVAMGMAANPDLRVMFVRDGSLLDDDSMAALRKQVTDGDFQLWVERVGDSDAGAVVIEDGEVAQ